MVSFCATNFASTHKVVLVEAIQNSSQEQIKLQLSLQLYRLLYKDLIYQKGKRGCETIF